MKTIVKTRKENSVNNTPESIADFNCSLLSRLKELCHRWIKILEIKQCLYVEELHDDFKLISEILRKQGIDENLRNELAKCRDKVIARPYQRKSLTKQLDMILELIPAAQQAIMVHKIRRQRSDQGMSVRYRPLSKRLEREKIRKIGRTLAYTDRHTDDADTTRLVRRFVEKRAAQAVHKYSRRDRRARYEDCSAKLRQKVRRATSFSLYKGTYTEFDPLKRLYGTHWRVEYVKSKRSGYEKRLKAKYSYGTYEEAAAACDRYMRRHPEDEYPMTPYMCVECGKWHIGHNHDITSIAPEIA